MPRSLRRVLRPRQDHGDRKSPRRRRRPADHHPKTRPFVDGLALFRLFDAMSRRVASAFLRSASCMCARASASSVRCLPDFLPTRARRRFGGFDLRPHRRGVRLGFRRQGRFGIIFFQEALIKGQRFLVLRLAVRPGDVESRCRQRLFLIGSEVIRRRLGVIPAP